MYHFGLKILHFCCFGFNFYNEFSKIRPFKNLWNMINLSHHYQQIQRSQLQYVIFLNRILDIIPRWRYRSWWPIKLYISLAICNFFKFKKRNSLFWIQISYLGLILALKTFSLIKCLSKIINNICLLEYFQISLIFQHPVHSVCDLNVAIKFSQQADFYKK